MHKERRAIITALVASFALLRTCFFLPFVLFLFSQSEHKKQKRKLRVESVYQTAGYIAEKICITKKCWAHNFVPLLCLQNFNTLYAAYSTFRLMFGEEQWFLLGDTKESDYLIVSVCFAPEFVFSKTRSSKAPDNNCVLFNGDIAVRDYAALSKTTHFLDARATKS